MNKNMTVNEYIVAHCSDIMDRALIQNRYVPWKRSCAELSDIDFIRQGIIRCLSPVDSGRHFLQMFAEHLDGTTTLSTYFNALKSSRRANMLKALEAQSYLLNCETMANKGIDYLKEYPELDDYTIEAADGHFIDHACHTPKGENGKVSAAGSIYALNLRYGLLRPLCVVTNGTVRHHEIPVLRRYIEAQNTRESEFNKQIYVYDKAATDYSWWESQKRHNNFMVSVQKENAVATMIEPISYDENSPVNTGVESYSVYQSKSAKFNLVCYRDPETQILHRFISTLPKSMSPGIIAILYFKRWTIEKAFNNSKSDLKERKAWSSNIHSLNSQMRLTAMTYNLIRIFEEISKIENPELIHPSDKKYNETLAKRQQIASENGRFVNPLLFNARITRICSNTIRAIQCAILTNKPLLRLFESLSRWLKPQLGSITQH